VKALRRYGLTALAIGLSFFVFVVPFLFIVNIAIKDRAQSAELDFSWPTSWPVWENLVAVVSARNFMLVTATVNSVILTVASVTLLVVFAAMVGYVRQRRKSRWNGLVDFLVLAGLMMDGEFVVFVGPSGCGKSTLLRMIAGLEEITGGERCGSVDQCRQRGRAAQGPCIAMVFQSYALYPHMTVYDNIAFGLHHRQTPKPRSTQGRRGGAHSADRIHLLERRPASCLAASASASPSAAPSCAAIRVPVRRAAVQPRRQAARRHARRTRQAPRDGSAPP
jgi:hypothetical protein